MEDGVLFSQNLMDKKKHSMLLIHSYFKPENYVLWDTVQWRVTV